ncbi:serpin B10 [Copidosoma floridanum]|uniref:serpin B10 n=1 Tax=Copidosoma floridanum TaxID=29053 RepID=UPI000C6F8450|nr:serpin B10 [Copidosoma floridanum]
MAEKIDEAVLSVTKGAEGFTTDFHKSLAGKNKGNFVSSGLSAHTVLSMAAYGADGSSAQEMRKTLHLPVNDSHAHQGFQGLIDMLNNEDLFMVIVVPNAIDGLEKIENNLEKLELQYEHFKYSRQEVNLSLPKFKVESTHELNAHLMELGMNEIFTERANFKGICDESVMVSKVMQKAFIEVNEEGSEAAAVTGIRIVKRSLPLPPIELQVDRPFYFKIVDANKNITFFSGRVKKPESS